MCAYKKGALNNPSLRYCSTCLISLLGRVVPPPCYAMESSSHEVDYESHPAAPPPPHMTLELATGEMQTRGGANLRQYDPLIALKIGSWPYTLSPDDLYLHACPTLAWGDTGERNNPRGDHMTLWQLRGHKLKECRDTSSVDWLVNRARTWKYVLSNCHYASLPELPSSAANWRYALNQKYYTGQKFTSCYFQL